MNNSIVLAQEGLVDSPERNRVDYKDRSPAEQSALRASSQMYSDDFAAQQEEMQEQDEEEEDADQPMLRSRDDALAADIGSHTDVTEQRHRVASTGHGHEQRNMIGVEQTRSMQTGYS